MADYKYPFAGADQDVKSKVWWSGGTPIPGYPENEWRYDKCGFVMRYQDHGDRDSENGWEIDHIKPLAKGGSNDYSNLQPLNWKNNAAKADKYPWTCGT